MERVTPRPKPPSSWKPARSPATRDRRAADRVSPGPSGPAVVHHDPKSGLDGRPRRRNNAACRRGRCVARGAHEGGAFYTLVPIRPRRRGERRSLRTFPGASLRPPLAFNPDTPRRLSTPPDAFELHPDVRSYGTDPHAAKVEYLHPTHNFGIVSYDAGAMPRAACAAVKTIRTHEAGDPERPRFDRGDEVVLVGLSGSLRPDGEGQARFIHTGSHTTASAR
jgi:hypothetical protein